jgi:hypothetical protein
MLDVDLAAPEIGRGPTLVVLTDGQAGDGGGRGALDARCAEFIDDHDRRRWRFRAIDGAVVAEIRSDATVHQPLCRVGTPVTIRRDSRGGAVAWSITESDDTAVFGVRERLLAAAGRDLPLPHEPAPGWRVEVANTPEHLVASEVAVGPDGCTTAWNHLRLGLFREDAAVWAGPGETAVVAGYQFEVHASAWPVEANEGRCAKPARAVWSIMATDTAAAAPDPGP